jgi:parvulin-like peptidyl-prolyl isomerase
VKSCVLATVVVLAVALLATACGGSLPAGAIAMVGNAEVTKAQFDAIIKEAKAQAASSESTFPAVGSSEYNQYAAQIVEYLVGQEIIAQAAVGMGIRVTSKDIAKAIAQLEKANGGVKHLDTLLKQSGMTPAELTQETKAELIAKAISKKVIKQARIAPVTDAQALAYYKKNKSKYVTAEKRNLREILVKSKAQALKVRALLLAGASWQTLAEQYSIDPGSKDKGGLYTDVTSGQMVAAFSKVAFSLPLHLLSPPVSTQYGWFIITVTKITKGSTMSFAKVEASIRSTLLQTQQQTVWSNWLTQASKAAKVSYATGYDPAKLAASTSASPSPSSSASASPTVSSGASSSP